MPASTGWPVLETLLFLNLSSFSKSSNNYAMAFWELPLDDTAFRAAIVNPFDSRLTNCTSESTSMGSSVMILLIFVANSPRMMSLSFRWRSRESPTFHTFAM